VKGPIGGSSIDGGFFFIFIEKNNPSTALSIRLVPCCHSQTQLLGIHENTSGSPTKVLGDDLKTKNYEFNGNPQIIPNVSASDFLNAIFGRPS
jgi:hypothetical protein